MSRVKRNSTLLAKYQKMYEKNPRSRVFAPLAEAYRKLGMIDDALKVLKEGLKYHPSYTLGYIVLGQCYYDLEKYELSYSTVRSFIPSHLENITLQKLYAQTCMELGHLEESLQTFKHILLLNPKDVFVAEKIKLLEDDLLIEDQVEQITEEDAATSQDLYDEDDWVQVNFGQKQEDETETVEEEDDIDEWSMEKDTTLQKFKEEVQTQSLEVKEYRLDDDYFLEDYDNHAEDVITELDNGDDSNDVTEEKTDQPIITHTLVDLYITQGHFDKAQTILEGILKLHPHDMATQKKLIEVNELSRSESDLEKFSTPITSEENITTEEDGQKVLSEMIETTVDFNENSNEQNKLDLIEEAFLNFSSELKKRHHENQTSGK